MPKTNPLAQSLTRQAPSAANPAATVTERPRLASKPGRTFREGRVLVGGHYAPEVQIALKVIAAEERTTVQALIAEAINGVFAKRGKPEIAAMQADA